MAQNGHFSISIHALREEGDDIIQDYVLEGKKFLSTPSARRATSTQSKKFWQERISIHALREEGDAVRCAQDVGIAGISIHALREEGDSYWPYWKERTGAFLSTPSARRATAAISYSFPPPVFLSTPSARRATCASTA